MDTEYRKIKQRQGSRATLEAIKRDQFLAFDTDQDHLLYCPDGVSFYDFYNSGEIEAKFTSASSLSVALTGSTMTGQLNTPSVSATTVSASFYGPLSGNASTSTSAAQADKLKTSQTFTIAGDVTATGQAFNGSAGVTLTTILPAITTAGTYTKTVVNAKGQVTSGGVFVASDIPVLDASKITTGTFDVARIPVLPSQIQITSTGSLSALTSAQTSAIGQGTVVTTTDGFRWVYTGSGSKTVSGSYTQLADITPDWSVIANRPTNVSTWTNDAGYLTNSTADTRYYTKTQTDAKYLPYTGGSMSGPIIMGQGAVTSASTLSTSRGYQFDSYCGIVAFNSSTQPGVGGTIAPSVVGSPDGPFIYGWGGVSLGYTNVTSAGGLVAALRTQGTTVYVAGGIYEAGTALSNKYAAKVHTHLWADITDKPSTFTPAAHNQAWSTITGTPTTLAGYGITSADSLFASINAGTATKLQTARTIAGVSFDGTANISIPYANLTGLPSAFTPVAHTHAWSDITSGKPTTLAGYGITDAVSSSDSRLTDARTPINNANYVFGDNSTGSRSITDFNAILKSGFGSGPSATGAPTTGWYHIITNKYHGDTTGWLFQIAAGFGNGASPAAAEGYYVRIKEGTNAPTAWRKLWHDGNLTGDQSGHYHSADRAWANLTGVPANVQNPASYFQPLLTNPVTGTGTTNQIPLFTGANSIGNSILFQDTAWGVLNIKQTPQNNQLGIAYYNSANNKIWQNTFRTTDNKLVFSFYDGTNWNGERMSLDVNGNATFSGAISTANGSSFAGDINVGSCIYVPSARINATWSGSGSERFVCAGNGRFTDYLAVNGRLYANDCQINGVVFGSGSINAWNTALGEYASGVTATDTGDMNRPELNSWSRSAIGTWTSNTNSPFGNYWYNMVNVRHRNGSGDGASSWGGQLAWGMTGAQNRLAFRSRNGDNTWQPWYEVWTNSNLNQNCSTTASPSFTGLTVNGVMSATQYTTSKGGYFGRMQPGALAYTFMGDSSEATMGSSLYLTNSAMFGNGYVNIRATDTISLSIGQNNYLVQVGTSTGLTYTYNGSSILSATNSRIDLSKPTYINAGLTAWNFNRTAPDTYNDTRDLSTVTNGGPTLGYGINKVVNGGSSTYKTYTLPAATAGSVIHIIGSTTGPVNSPRYYVTSGFLVAPNGTTYGPTQPYSQYGGFTLIADGSYWWVV